MWDFLNPIRFCLYETSYADILGASNVERNGGSKSGGKMTNGQLPDIFRIDGEYVDPWFPSHAWPSLSQRGWSRAELLLFERSLLLLVKLQLDLLQSMKQKSFLETWQLSPSNGSSRMWITMTPRSRRWFITHTEYTSITPSEKACLLVSRRRPCPSERGDPLWREQGDLLW